MPLRFTIQIIPLRAPCASEIAARSLPAPPVSPRLSRAQLLNLRPGTARRVPCPPRSQVPRKRKSPRARQLLHLAHHPAPDAYPLRPPRQRPPCRDPTQQSPTSAPAPAARFRPSLATALPSTTDTPEATLPPTSSRLRYQRPLVTSLNYSSPSPPPHFLRAARLLCPRSRSKAQAPSTRRRCQTHSACATLFPNRADHPRLHVSAPLKPVAITAALQQHSRSTPPSNEQPCPSSWRRDSAPRGPPKFASVLVPALPSTSRKGVRSRGGM